MAFDPRQELIKRGLIKPDPTTLEGLASLGLQAGLGDDVAKILDSGPPKLSFLQRLSKGLGAFNTAEAVATGQEQGLFAGVKKYGQNVMQGLGSAITGKDYEGERRTYADLAKKAGIENGIARFGIGFLGDVLLDPTTYFGGALVKGLTKTIGKGGSVAMSGLQKVNPEAAAGVSKAVEGVQDALGAAFKYGYKASKGAKIATSQFKGFLGNKLQTEAARQLDNLGVGVLTDEQRAQAALAMMTGRRAEAALGKGTTAGREAAFKTARSFSDDPQVNQYIEALIKESDDMAKLADLPDGYATYYPGLRKDRLEKVVKAAQNTDFRAGSKDWMKQWKDQISDQELDTNAARAFFTRKAQIIKNKETTEFLKGFVERFGKPLKDFKSSDEALREGYALVKSNGIFGESLGYVPKWDAKLLADSFGDNFQSVSMLAKAFGFDAVTSLFKRAVTGLFLPFHVRNFASGTVQNFEVLGIDALNPRNINIGRKIAYKILKGEPITGDAITVAGKTMQFDDAMKPFVDSFGGSSFYSNDFMDAVKEGEKYLADAAPIFSKATGKETLKTLGLGSNAAPFKAARAVGQYIEIQQKATAYITALSQGRNIDEALELAEKAGFDYSALTKFESEIMRRIVPFYSFTRKNLELQLDTLANSPQRINQVLALIRNIGEPATADERQNLPDYVKNSLGVKLPDTPDGLKQYISNFGTPIEQFADMLGNNPIFKALSMTNPLLKVPVEIGIGKDSFRQKDLKEVYDAKEYGSMPKTLKDMLEIKEVKKPILVNRNGKLVKTGERTAYVADPVKLLIARSLFTSRGFTYLDTMFGSDLPAFTRAMKLTTGLKPQAIDVETSKGLKERDKKRELEDLLLKTGEVSQFRRVFVPKAKKTEDLLGQ